MQTNQKINKSILSLFVISFILLIFVVPVFAQTSGNAISDFFNGILNFLSSLFGSPTGFQTAGGIEDDFNDNSFDTAVWNRTSSSTITEQNQAINASSAGSGSPYQILQSIKTFSGSKEFGVLIKKTSVANSGWAKLTITDSSKDFDSGQNGGQIFFDLDGRFGAHIKVNGQSTDYKFTTTYYSTGTYYWIIIKRNSDGKLIFRIEDSNHNIISEKTTTQALPSSVALKFNPVEVAQNTILTRAFVDSAYVRDYSGTTTTTQPNVTTTTKPPNATTTTQPNATTTTTQPNATTTTVTTQPNATTTTQPNATTTTKPNATTTTAGVTTTVTTQPNVTTTTQKALSCSDTDGGNSIFVPGTATDQDGNSYVDACVNNSTLMEYYCSNNAIASQKANCQYGCNNGACKSYLENLIEQILELLNKILGILGGGGTTTTTTVTTKSNVTTTTLAATTTTVNVTTTTKPPATTSTTAPNVTTTTVNATTTTQPNATTTTSAGLPDLSISASDVARTAYSCDKSKGSFGDGNFFVVIRNIGGSTSGNFNASFIAYNSTHRFELFISNSTTSLVASSNYAPPNLNYVYNISYLGEYPTSIRAGGFFNISGYFNTSNYPGLIVLYPGTSRSIGPAPSQKFNLNITVDNFNEVQESNENNNFVSISNINYVKC